MTNGDKIRAMIDEELKVLLDNASESAWSFCHETMGRWNKGCERFSSCADCILDWLKQEAEP